MSLKSTANTIYTGAYSKIPVSLCTNLIKVEEALTLINPDYLKAKRFGTFFSNQEEIENIKYLVYFFYEEDENNQEYICVPRNTHKLLPEYFVSDYYEEFDLNTIEFSAPISWIKPLRDYQQEYVQTIIESNAEGDILGLAPCGHGKTVIGTWLAVHLGKPTLILVPTYAIASQWITTIEDFTDCKNYCLTNPSDFTKRTYQNNWSDIMVMSFDLFDARQTKFPLSFIEHWGTVLLDEAHLVGAPTYQPVLDVIPCSLRIALTATFRRGDGMTDILQYYFGHAYVMENRHVETTVIGVETGITVPNLMPLHKIPGGKKHSHKNWLLFESWLKAKGVKHELIDEYLLTLDMQRANEMIKKPDYSYKSADLLTVKACLKRLKEYHREFMFVTAETYLANLKSRRDLIKWLTVEAVKSGRVVLILSKRKESLKEYYSYFNSINIPCGIIYGETSKNDNNFDWCRKHAKVICGIFNLAKFGLDIDTIDTGILEHYMSDVEQAAGRTARAIYVESVDAYLAANFLVMNYEKHNIKNRPLLLYMYDDYAPGKHMYMEAARISENTSFTEPMNAQEIKQLFFSVSNALK